MLQWADDEKWIFEGGAEDTADREETVLTCSFSDGKSMYSQFLNFNLAGFVV